MGQSVSCKNAEIEDELFAAIREGDLQRVKNLLNNRPKLVTSAAAAASRRPNRHKLYPLHDAALHGQADVLAFLLDRNANPNSVNHHKQTPLMLACKNGRLLCVERLMERGANVLMFDSPLRRTCLHYAARSGHRDCMQRVLDAGRLPAVANTWGFGSFVNVRDGSGSTPLHVAARFSHGAAVRLLLNNGAIVCAVTTSSDTGSTRNRSSRSVVGSTPLHLAARGGSPDCVRELLAWGADRNHRDSRGHTPYYVAVKYGNTACAALLNPQVAEPFVWPSSWKFMSDLDPEARELLEAALAKANEAREKRIFASIGLAINSAAKQGSKQDVDAEDTDSDAEEEEDAEEEGEDDDDKELCSICFENPCTIEVQDCSHKMCAGCTLALCCHSKPNPAMPRHPPLTCPFCRRTIVQFKRAVSMAEASTATVEASSAPAIEASTVTIEANAEEREGMTTTTAMAMATGSESEQASDDSRVFSVSMVKKAGGESSSGSFKGLGKGSFKLLSSRGGSGRRADKDLPKDISASQELCPTVII